MVVAIDLYLTEIHCIATGTPTTSHAGPGPAARIGPTGRDPVPYVGGSLSWIRFELSPSRKHRYRGWLCGKIANLQKRLLRHNLLNCQSDVRLAILTSRTNDDWNRAASRHGLWDLHIHLQDAGDQSRSAPRVLHRGRQTTHHRDNGFRDWQGCRPVARLPVHALRIRLPFARGIHGNV